MIVKVNNDTGYLDTTELVDGAPFTKLAYVVNSSAGITKLDSGYFTFFLKDVNANTIRAQLFDVKDFVESGFTVKALLNKPVKVSFTAQIYNGKWSLIIKKIELWDGDFDYSVFRGKVTCDGTALENFVTETTGQSLDYKYSTLSLASVCDGRCGGFLKLMDSVRVWIGNFYDLPCIEQKGLDTVFLCAMHVYCLFLEEKEKYPIVPSGKVFSILNNLEQQVDGTKYSFEVMDCCRALLGCSKPQHIYSHLVCKGIKHCNDNLNLVYTNAGLSKGALTTIGGEELLRA